MGHASNKDFLKNQIIEKKDQISLWSKQYARYYVAEYEIVFDRVDYVINYKVKKKKKKKIRYQRYSCLIVCSREIEAQKKKREKVEL